MAERIPDFSFMSHCIRLWFSILCINFICQNTLDIISCNLWVYICLHFTPQHTITNAKLIYIYKYSICSLDSYKHLKVNMFLKMPESNCWKSSLGSRSSTRLPLSCRVYSIFKQANKALQDPLVGYKLCRTVCLQEQDWRGDILTSSLTSRRLLRLHRRNERRVFHRMTPFE